MNKFFWWTLGIMGMTQPPLMNFKKIHVFLNFLAQGQTIIFVGAIFFNVDFDLKIG